MQKSHLRNHCLGVWRFGVYFEAETFYFNNYRQRWCLVTCFPWDQRSQRGCSLVVQSSKKWQRPHLPQVIRTSFHRHHERWPFIMASCLSLKCSRGLFADLSLTSSTGINDVIPGRPVKSSVSVRIAGVVSALPRSRMCTRCHGSFVTRCVNALCMLVMHGRGQPCLPVNFR